jgi:pimeloyl-ACP methyl ester carboxylesterase
MFYRGVNRASWILKASIAAFFVPAFMADAFAGIKWQPCEGVADAQFECASVYVPLNHQRHVDSYSAFRSDERMVRIALARLPASGGTNKKGSLFLNPGGPGGSGVDMVLNIGPYLFTEEVRRNYDLVGFDPRGIARSDELTCFEDLSELAPFIGVPDFPITHDEVSQYRNLDQYLSGMCAMRASELINHMSTADVARDLDLLRQAVGDEKLYFAGYSYGSYLGVTYANLFPENVGAMVLDGVIDPIAWSTGRGWASYFLPYSTRMRSAEGAQDTLQEFFRTCDEGGIEACALAGDAESRFNSVVERIKEEPLVILDDNGDEIVIDYSTVVIGTLNALYSPASWSELASTAAVIEENLGDSEIANRYYSLRHALGFEDDRGDVIIPQPEVAAAGVSCSDSDNPYYYDYWSWAAEISDRVYKYFGSPWTWKSSICHSWVGSKESRYAGDFKVNTDRPVLVVNTLFDPATPYHGAKTVERLLRNSRLLTVNGWGHTSLFISECADHVVAEYLLRGALPERGATCDPDTTPFGASLPVDDSGYRQKPFAATQFSDREKQKALRRKILKDMMPYHLH